MVYALAQSAAQDAESRCTPARAQRRRAKSGCGPWSAVADEYLGRCQVGSETNRSCFRPAAVEVRGVPLYERSAYEQEIYLAIGELTQEQTDGRAKQDQGFRHRRLVVALAQVKHSIARRAAEAEKRPEAVKR